MEGPGPGHHWGGGFGPAGSPVLAGRTPRAPLAACPRLAKESRAAESTQRPPGPRTTGFFPAGLRGARGSRSRWGSQGQELRAPGHEGLEVGSGPGPERRRMSSLMGHARRGWGARDTPLTRTESSSPLRVVRRNQGLERAARRAEGDLGA